MKKLILFALMALLIPSMTLAATTIGPTAKLEGPGYVAYKFTSPDTLAANTSDHWIVSLPNWRPWDVGEMKVIAVTSSGASAADSVHIGIATGPTQSGPWTVLVAETSETLHCAGTNVGTLAAVDVYAPVVRFSIRNRKASAITPTAWVIMPKRMVAN